MIKKHARATIDMGLTGKKIKRMLESAGYKPSMLQEILQLSCVQPIYRWYKGKTLPTVEHLLTLSDLLGVHMEELLVKEGAELLYSDILLEDRKDTKIRLMAYYRHLREVAA